MSTSSLPVILLAFANDKVGTGAGYLRGLTYERNRLRDALREAENAGLCELVIEPDATIDRLFDVFQDPRYRDRIAIFHYGGHADSYQLLLEDAQGQTVIANTGGLVSFLGKQKGLQLVFLNGCLSGKQADDLVEAGIPAVIGTAAKIEDKVATDLATRFYTGLAKGNALGRVWEESVDQTHTQTEQTGGGSGPVASLFFAFPDPSEETDFPWEIRFGPHEAEARAWNLPAAANDPLFGLGLPSQASQILHPRPYPGLRPFTEKEALLFFGRGKEIRELFTKLQGEQPVVLLLGQPAVGKSSLLQAGLIPRAHHRLAFEPLRPEQGQSWLAALKAALTRAGDRLSLVAPSSLNKNDETLLSLQEAVAKSEGLAKTILARELAKWEEALQQRTSLRSYWLQIETALDKALVLVVDGLAETEAQGESWQAFLQKIKVIFGGENGPQGKLLLSYRTSLHWQLREELRAASLPYQEMELKPLSQGGLVEAISGVSEQTATRTRYNLQIEAVAGADLPRVVADDLLEADYSPQGPVLQWILQRLWEKASAEAPRAPSFSLRLYQGMKQSGELMSAFLAQQLQGLKRDFPEEVRSGLALDLLFFHTTVMGVSQNCSEATVEAAYRSRWERVKPLWEACQQRYLLTAYEPGHTGLIHDLLAPVVIKAFGGSMQPGQQAARVLRGKLEEGREEQENEAQEAPYLDEVDLAIVEKGRDGMRDLSGEEERLLEVSREKKAARDRAKRRNQRIKVTLAAAICLFAVLAAWQWQVSERNFRQSRSRQLAYLAQEAIADDRTQALRVAARAYDILEETSGTITTQTLSDLFHAQDSLPLYHRVFAHEKNVNTAVFSPDGQFILTASDDNSARLWNREGQLIRHIPHPLAVRCARFSPNGNQLLTLGSDSLRLWNREGRLLHALPAGEAYYPEDLANWSTDGAQLIPVAYRDGAFFQWADTVEADVRKFFPPGQEALFLLSANYLIRVPAFADSLRDTLAQDVEALAFSPEGQQFLMARRPLGFPDSWVELRDANGECLKSFRYAGEVRGLAFHPQDQVWLTAAGDGSAKLWDFTQSALLGLPKYANVLKLAGFSPEGDRLLTVADGDLRIWDQQGQPLDTLAFSGLINRASFSPDGKQVLLALGESRGMLWEPGLAQPVYLPHQAQVQEANFSPDGEKMVSVAYENLLRIWGRDGSLQDSFDLGAMVDFATFSSDGQQVIARCGQDSCVYLISLADKKPQPYRHRGPVWRVTLSPDRQEFLSHWGDQNVVTLWSATGDSLCSLHHREPLGKVLEFSPDGNFLYTAGQVVRKWNREGELIDSLVHKASITELHFSADGAYLLTVAYDNVVRLWREDGTLVAAYAHPSDVLTARFSPDGQQIITACVDGRARIWWTPALIKNWLENASVYELSREDEGRLGL
jgi:WD40 repeat protein